MELLDKNYILEITFLCDLLLCLINKKIWHQILKILANTQVKT
jgi:hypothetical protein